MSGDGETLKIPAEEYHADELAAQFYQGPTLSSSIARLLVNKTPLHAWTAHPKLNPDFEPTYKPVFDVGSAAHAVVLEGKPWEDVCVFINHPDWRTNAAKEARDDARERGKIPLLVKDSDRLAAMVGALRRQLDEYELDPPLFGAGTPEQTIVWNERTSVDGVGVDVACRARVDWLHDDHRAIDDYKTTSASAAPAAWSRRAFEIGADIQTAFYRRAVFSLDDEGRLPEVRYIVQESSPPYAVSVNTMGAAALSIGDGKVDLALELWARCLAADKWPGYPPALAAIDTPSWEEAKYLERVGEVENGA